MQMIGIRHVLETLSRSPRRDVMVIHSGIETTWTLVDTGQALLGSGVSKIEKEN